MPDVIDGVSSSPLYPNNSHLQVASKSPPSECRALVLVPKKENKGEVAPLDPSLHRSLFAGIRSSVTDIDGLRGFFAWTKKTIQGDWQYKARQSLSCDESFGEAVDDLARYYSKQGINLGSLLKEMLVENEHFEDKALIIKMLVSIGLEDEVTSEFFIPALESRKNLKNLGINKNFCCNFISVLDDSAKKEFFQSLDYSEITDINSFAASVLKTTYPETALNIFSEIIYSKEAEYDDSKENKVNIHKLRMILVSLMKNLVNNQMKFSVDIPEKLYKSNTDNEMGEELLEILTTNFGQDASRILREVMMNDSDDSEESRIRRFYAINHFVRATGEYGASVMKDFILKEKDSFLVFYACYGLSKICGVDGRRALIGAIVNNVRENQLSLPLAAVTKLSAYGEPYQDLIRDLMVRNYKEKYDLVQAYKNLSEASFVNFYMDDEGDIIFSLTEGSGENLVIDLISNVGIEKFLDWAAYGEGKNEQEKENVKRNAMDLLNYACGKNFQRIKEILMKAAVNDRGDMLSIFYKLGDMSELAKAS